MDQLIAVLKSLRFEPIALLDIALTAILIYGLFSLIRGTRAVTLVIGVIALYAVYAVAQFLGLQLLSQILQTGAVVGLLALVVVFQPELRRALERIGRVGSFGWLINPSAQGAVDRLATEIADAAGRLSAERVGALIVIERETGLQDTAETGVMLHADLTAELLRSIFSTRSPLHDGAVIVHGEMLLAAGAVLPLPETSIHTERFGTRHRAALGITEQTDAVAVVVSEESGAISLVERARIIRNLDRDRLASSLAALLAPGGGHRGVFRLPAPARPAVLERDFRAPLRRLRRLAASEPAVPAAGAPREVGATGGSERR
ncbi:MAG TPA: diadenylate cyclase CdaA [Candidatus Limnocylindrales bacterium]|jgi:diadenylate cyclase|nr:diadenylate cyclase CdaA [Candidatus Limnocylindrales bacterium]